MIFVVEVFLVHSKEGTTCFFLTDCFLIHIMERICLFCFWFMSVEVSS